MPKIKINKEQKTLIEERVLGFARGKWREFAEEMGRKQGFAGESSRFSHCQRNLQTRLKT